MNLQFDWLFSSISDRILNASLYGSLFLVLIFAVCRLFPKIPAYIQSWLWKLGYLKMFIAFLFLSSLVLPVLQAPNPISNNIPARAMFMQTITTSGLPDALPVETAIPAVQSNPLTITQLLIIAWLMGVLVFSIRIMIACKRTWALRRKCNDFNNKHLQSELAEMCKQMGIRRQPKILIGDIKSPLVCGIIKPCIILPLDTICEENYINTRLVLAHELAHLKRLDLLWAWLPMLAQCLFFYNPVVWFTRKEWHFAQETACDAIAIDTISVPKVDYGQMLLNYVSVTDENKQFATVGIVETFDSLKRRINAMKNYKNLSIRKKIIIAVIIAVIGAAGVIPWAVGTSKNSQETDKYFPDITWNGVPSVLEAAVKSPRYKEGGFYLANPKILDTIRTNEQHDAFSYRLAIDFLRSLTSKQIAYFKNKQILPFKNLSSEQQKALAQMRTSRIEGVEALSNEIAYKSLVSLQKFDKNKFTFVWSSPTKKKGQYSLMFVMTFSKDKNERFGFPYRRLGESGGIYPPNVHPAWDGVTEILNAAVKSSRYKEGSVYLTDSSKRNAISSRAQQEIYSYRLAIDFMRSLTPEQIAYFKNKQALPFIYLNSEQKKALRLMSMSRWERYWNPTSKISESYILVESSKEHRYVALFWYQPSKTNTPKHYGVYVLFAMQIQTRTEEVLFEF